MLRAMAGVAFVMVVLAGCSDGASDSRPPASTLQFTDRSEGRVTPSAVQLALLADGELTFDEYESAVLATVQCLKEAGLTMVDTPRLDLSGTRYVFGYFAGRDDEEFDRSRAIFGDCYTLHQAVVDREWGRLTAPPEGRLQDALAALANCLELAGFEIAGPISQADFIPLTQQDPEQFNRCLAAVSKEFSIPFVLN